MDRVKLSVLLWVTLCLMVSCGSDSSEETSPDAGPGETDCETIEGDVSASAWVTDLTGVTTYRYSGTLTSNDLTVELLGDEQETLGVAVVSQILEGEENAGGMRVVFSQDEAEVMRLVSLGLRAERGYAVTATLSDAERSVDVFAEFESTACQFGTGEERALCAEPVPVEAAEYALPSCGLLWDSAREADRSPRLQRMRYRVPAAESSGAPSTGIGSSADGGAYLLDVYDRGAIASSDDVSTWLDETGASSIIGTEAEELLTSFYVDTVWRQAFRDRALACGAVEANAGALTGCPADARALTRRQAQSCSSAGARNEDLFGSSAPDDGSSDSDCSGGCSTGDPHMTSFDGHSFDFQGVGEYILARATEGEPFEVQVRTRPINDPPREFCRDISVNSAVAFEIGERRIAIYTDREQRLWVDGEPVASEPGLEIDLPEGASYEIGRTSWEFRWPSGERLKFKEGAYPNVYFDLPDSRLGEVVGLLGTFNGNMEDDFTTRNGEMLGTPTFEGLYRQFGDSWRVSSFESLFDYADGESTETFSNLDFPTGPVDVSVIPESDREGAAETCREEGIVDPWLFDACVLDVVCSSDPSRAADSAGELAPPGAVTMPGEVSFTVSGLMRPGPATETLESGGAQNEAACPEDLLDAVWIYPEAAGVELAADTTVDAVESGAYDEGGALDGGSISAGTVVHSFVIHYDRNGVPSEIPASGGATFSGEILGVVATGETLGATDDALGASFTYPSDSARAIELDKDEFTISDDRRTISVRLRAATDVDQIRVLVASPQEEMQ